MDCILEANDAFQDVLERKAGPAAVRTDGRQARSIR